MRKGPILASIILIVVTVAVGVGIASYLFDLPTFKSEVLLNQTQVTNTSEKSPLLGGDGHGYGNISDIITWTTTMTVTVTSTNRTITLKGGEPIVTVINDTRLDFYNVTFRVTRIATLIWMAAPDFKPLNITLVVFSFIGITPTYLNNYTFSKYMVDNQNPFKLGDTVLASGTFTERLYSDRDKNSWVDIKSILWIISDNRIGE